jgi:hypothetical protein
MSREEAARVPAFHYVLFPGAVPQAAFALLNAEGWRIVDSRVERGSVAALLAAAGPRGGARSVKALFRLGTFTVLADPERAVGQDVATLERVCRLQRVGALVAGWEPATSSASLLEYAADGLVRRTVRRDGQAPLPDVQPRRELVAVPDYEGLRAALAQEGADLDGATGALDVTLLTVERAGPPASEGPR